MVVFSLGTIAGALGGLVKLADNPIIAYFLVLGVLLLDATQGSLLGNPGAIGSFLSFVIAQMSGGQINIAIATIHLLFLFAIFPVVIFVAKKSGRR